MDQDKADYYRKQFSSKISSDQDQPGKEKSGEKVQKTHQKVKRLGAGVSHLRRKLSSSSPELPGLESRQSNPDIILTDYVFKDAGEGDGKSSSSPSARVRQKTVRFSEDIDALTHSSDSDPNPSHSSDSDSSETSVKSFRTISSRVSGPGTQSQRTSLSESEVNVASSAEVEDGGQGRSVISPVMWQEDGCGLHTACSSIAVNRSQVCTRSESLSADVDKSDVDKG